MPPKKVKRRAGKGVKMRAMKQDQQLRQELTALAEGSDDICSRVDNLTIQYSNLFKRFGSINKFSIKSKRELIQDLSVSIRMILDSFEECANLISSEIQLALSSLDSTAKITSEQNQDALSSSRTVQPMEHLDSGSSWTTETPTYAPSIESPDNPTPKKISEEDPSIAKYLKLVQLMKNLELVSTGPPIIPVHSSSVATPVTETQEMISVEDQNLYSIGTWMIANAKRVNTQHSKIFSVESGDYDMNEILDCTGAYVRERLSQSPSYDARAELSLDDSDTTIWCRKFLEGPLEES